MTTDKSMTERGASAAAAYLERIGIEVLENNGTDTIIARDGEHLVHVAVITRDEASEVQSELPKRAMKRFTELGQFMADRGIEGAEFRLDTITIRAIAEDRALLRHHRDTLPGGDEMDG